MKTIRGCTLCLVLLSVLLLLTACAPRSEVPESGSLRVLVDGKPVQAGTRKASAEEAQVWFTLEGNLLLTLPFSEAHEVSILQ